MIKSEWGIVWNLIPLLISIISLSFSIYVYLKNRPKLKFILYRTRYSFRAPNVKKELLRHSSFSMDMLVVNSGNKKLSIIDIVPPIEHVSEIKIYLENEPKPIYFLKKISKREYFETKKSLKEHIPLLDCSKFKLELCLEFKSYEERRSYEDDGMILDLHNKKFIIITSDLKKYYVNPNRILPNYL